ncbi:hypothetical protein BDA96_01G035300 [Sorghum bicolor]|uniref:Uncharacterized protein n=2 Tax=Sorghum bicolor TaxID=4558 RepID=A0A921UVY6_SORBI|nr:hypothetical protein BDA96_01G035300 [Sorghum bicolor]OQU90723.1 hypothetical protein SORBI_3001G034050 [Sorghum bicolor]
MRVCAHGLSGHLPRFPSPSSPARALGIGELREPSPTINNQLPASLRLLVLEERDQCNARKNMGPGRQCESPEGWNEPLKRQRRVQIGTSGRLVPFPCAIPARTANRGQGQQSCSAARRKFCTETASR